MKPKAEPRLWPQVGLEVREISLVKAMIAQHPEAFAVVEQKLCLRDRGSFELGLGRIDGARMSDFNEGRRFVGNQLRQIREERLPSPTRGPAPDLPNSPTPKPAEKA